MYIIQWKGPSNSSPWRKAYDRTFTTETAAAEWISGFSGPGWEKNYRVHFSKKAGA